MSKILRRVNVASKQIPADLVIKNGKIVNVFTHEIQQMDIAIVDGKIAGIGFYEGEKTIDAEGMYVLPGLIDAHLHVETSYVTPEEFGRVLVPHGITTTISDPHEIVNVCGLNGLEYMIRSAKKTALDIRYMMPSCVPCTGWESSGCTIDAQQMREGIHINGVDGVAEFMNAAGILQADPNVIAKLEMAQEENVIIDGHAPGLSGASMAGYIAAGIKTDHECSTLEEMKQRLDNGMYVELRYGSAAQELLTLYKGVTEQNSRRCLLCSDDRHLSDLIDIGDMDDILKKCVELGIDPITAVQMATLNTAECYRLDDRGAIAPGRRADIILVEDLKDFKVRKVFIEGNLCAEDGEYLLPIEREDISLVAHSMIVKDFCEEKLKLHLHGSKAHVIAIHPQSLLSDDMIKEVERDNDGDFVYNSKEDIARISVIERHQGTGNVANGLITGYGIKRGAVAISVGHDSHNILTVGTQTKDMAYAVEELIGQNGGVILVADNEVLDRFELPVAGLMSDKPAEYVREKLDHIRENAYVQLGINEDIEALMTLCFMSLPVIPDLKITDKGLFKVSEQRFITIDE